MDKKETRQDKFRRLASKRTNDILYKIRLLGNLANKSNYDYTDEDVIKVFGAIENEVRQAKNRFKIGYRKKEEFKL